MPQVATMLAALLHNCQINLLKKFIITGGWSFNFKLVIFGEKRVFSVLICCLPFQLSYSPQTTKDPESQ